MPKSWAGLRGESLKKETGVDGAIFCHKGRFISIWQTKKDAMEALKIIFEKEGIEFDAKGRIDLARYQWPGLDWPEIEELRATWR